MKKNVRGTFLAVAAAALMVTECGKKGTACQRRRHDGSCFL